jgi:hypothetical protein
MLSQPDVRLQGGQMHGLHHLPDQGLVGEELWSYVQVIPSRSLHAYGATAWVTVVGHSFEGAEQPTEVVPIGPMVARRDDHLAQMPSFWERRAVEPEISCDHIEDPHLGRARLPPALDALRTLLERALHTKPR